MNTDYIKIFTGTSILVNRLSSLLNNEKIPTIIKDHVNSGNLAGFGALGNSIELFIKEKDKENALEIINHFQEEIAK